MDGDQELWRTVAALDLERGLMGEEMYHLERNETGK